MILFSGIQPSGRLHIGAYFGAIKNWLMLQKQYNCLFSIVDMHTITVRQDPTLLRIREYDFLALYLAAGLDPEDSIIFCQSHIPAHAELSWILGCHTYMGELSRMTQFKDKSKQGAKVGVGLFTYPVLMAADILLYHTNLVPVGADQKQHVELARDLAIRFNNLYGEIFTVPEPYIPATTLGARIMSLQDPSKKMSKSDENEQSTLALLDPPEIVTKKIRGAVTDSGSEVVFDPDKPGVSNLLIIYSAITGKPIKAIEQDYEGKGYGNFKSDLAEIMVEFLQPIQERYKKIRNDQTYLDQVLRDGAARANAIAAPMLAKVQNIVGFKR